MPSTPSDCFSSLASGSNDEVGLLILLIISSLFSHYSSSTHAGYAGVAFTSVHSPHDDEVGIQSNPSDTRQRQRPWARVDAHSAPCHLALLVLIPFPSSSSSFDPPRAAPHPLSALRVVTQPLTPPSSLEPSPLLPLPPPSHFGGKWREEGAYSGPVGTLSKGPTWPGTTTTNKEPLLLLPLPLLVLPPIKVCQRPISLYLPHCAPCPMQSSTRS